ncbi:MAG: efflux RND transporter periplasmic adaptor subunit [Bacteroidales bacterium]|nr:efflux RND transporter periplasmic adaptor subunit [Bacteroidales bacterium]MBN2634459.1 efflux RND transporter periplasmic adaptor subunit [Bacteroidales bacterium]
MKKRIILSIALITAIMSCRNQDQNLTADVEIPVTVEDLKPRSIEEFVNTTGTAFPKGEIELKSKIPAAYFLELNPQTGRLWQLGDRIRTGMVIARLEDEEYVNSVKMETNQLNMELMETELRKQESLYEKGGVTLKELKTAGINYENAKTTVANSRLQLQKTRIVAPIDGVIVELPYYTQGTEVASGVTIAKIMDYKTMYMDVQLPEKYITVIKPGQKVNLTNYTIPNDTIIGNITQLSPAIDPDTRTFRGTIAVDNKEYLLRPGMFVKADIITARKDSAIVIPKSIILSRQRGKTVFTVDRGIAVEKVILTGLENLTEVEVTRGLVKDERIVTSGFETLSNRSKVKIIR